MTDQELIRLAMDEGFAAAAVVPVDEIVFDPAFRPYCAENICGFYGENHSCPPACGTPREMEERMRRFRRALVFQTRWAVAYHDKPAVKAAKYDHNMAMLRVIDRLRARGMEGCMAGASCCTLCERCSILDGEACKLPERRFSCLSAYCVFVRKLAESAGMEYCSDDGSLALFGLYAF